MIVIKLQGGLGNQLFQYAMGRATQEKINDSQLILDTSDFKHDLQRNFSLNNYQLESSVQTDGSGKYNMRYDRRENTILKLFIKFFPNITFEVLKLFGIYVWENREYREFSVKARKQILMHGFWQSPKYFDKVLTQLRTEIVLKHPLSAQNERLLASISRSNSVCVHVRRGDYLASSNTNMVCDDAYYCRALSNFESRYSHPKFFVFSDDIDFVKTRMNLGEHDIVYVDNKNIDVDELELMRSCKGFVIANSTFSWWAAVLSGSHEVITPKQWFSDGLNPKYLFLPDWTIL